MTHEPKQFAPFDAYVTYLAFKLHFSSASYDFFKFNGKTKASINSFNNRKDKYLFEKVAAKLGKEKFIERMLIEQIDNKNFWVKDILSKDNEIRYLKWRGFIEGFRYNFKSELNKIKEYCLLTDSSINDIFSCKNTIHPILFKMLLRKDVTIETFMSIDSLVGLSKKLNSREEYDPIWKDYYILMINYFPFISKYMMERDIIKKDFIDIMKDISYNINI